jgi:hypothetical protein
LSDALNAVRGGMSRPDIEKVVDDKNTVDSIVSAMVDVRAFLAFDSVIRLGVTIDSSSIPAARLMVFGWIKDLINERKD